MLRKAKKTLVGDSRKCQMWLRVGQNRSQWLRV